MFYNVMTGKKEELTDIITREFPQEKRFVVAVPHGGIYIPEECFNNLDYENETFSTEMDHFTHALYHLTNVDGAVVKTFIHRHVVDVNRYRTDNTLEGVIREIGFDRIPLIIVPYSVEEREQLLQRFYDPFSTLLREEMDALRNIYGKAFLLNGHSMSQEAPFIREAKEPKPRPAFCIGTRYSLSAEKDITKTFEEALRDYVERLNDVIKPYKTVVSVDYPFAGHKGLTEQYGKPKEGFNCLLLEVNRGLYYNETNKTAREEIIIIINNIISDSMKETLKHLI